MLDLEVVSLTAEWATVLVTAAGLGSLVTQIRAYRSLLDPFYDTRGRSWLGLWAEDDGSCFYLMPPTPQGPIIEGKYTKGLCGMNVIHISRKPVGEVGRASWTQILATFHPESLNPRPILREGKLEDVNPIIIPTDAPCPWMGWVQTNLLIKNGNKACTTITRTAFITCLALCNACQIYKHSGAAGVRIAYAGYTGIWTVQWPLGATAEVEFVPLNSHDPSQEMHPRTFERRVDKCVLMLMGIIHGPAVGKLSFPEPKDSGCSILKSYEKGFIAHGRTTHLYNMMGGDCYDVDYLLRRPYHDSSPPPSSLTLTLPNPELDQNRLPRKDQGPSSSIVYVPEREERRLAAALDSLPWSPLSWSIHRGMQSLLVAYGRPTLEAYREALVETLKDKISIHSSRLEAEGWNPGFVREHMADTAAASIAADGGDSGDSVRTVTAAARLCWDVVDRELDETSFWRERVGRQIGEKVTWLLSGEEVVALMKLWVLEWSNEIDHKLYRDMPLEMLVA